MDRYGNAMMGYNEYNVRILLLFCFIVELSGKYAMCSTSEAGESTLVT